MREEQAFANPRGPRPRKGIRGRCGVFFAAGVALIVPMAAVPGQEGTVPEATGKPIVQFVIVSPYMNAADKRVTDEAVNPFSLFKNGQGMTRDAFLTKLGATLKKAGVDVIWVADTTSGELKEISPKATLVVVWYVAHGKPPKDGSQTNQFQMYSNTWLNFPGSPFSDYAKTLEELNQLPAWLQKNDGVKRLYVLDMCSPPKAGMGSVDSATPNSDNYKEMPGVVVGYKHFQPEHPDLSLALLEALKELEQTHDPFTVGKWLHTTVSKLRTLTDPGVLNALTLWTAGADPKAGFNLSRLISQNRAPDPTDPPSTDWKTLKNSYISYANAIKVVLPKSFRKICASEPESLALCTDKSLQRQPSPIMGRNNGLDGSSTSVWVAPIGNSKDDGSVYLSCSGPNANARWAYQTRQKKAVGEMAFRELSDPVADVHLTVEVTGIQASECHRDSFRPKENIGLAIDGQTVTFDDKRQSLPPVCRFELKPEETGDSPYDRIPTEFVDYKFATLTPKQSEAHFDGYQVVSPRAFEVKTLMIFQLCINDPNIVCKVQNAGAHRPVEVSGNGNCKPIGAVGQLSDKSHHQFVAEGPEPNKLPGMYIGTSPDRETYGSVRASESDGRMTMEPVKFTPVGGAPTQKPRYRWQIEKGTLPPLQPLDLHRLRKNGSDYHAALGNPGAPGPNLIYELKFADLTDAEWKLSCHPSVNPSGTLVLAAETASAASNGRCPDVLEIKHLTGYPRLVARLCPQSDKCGFIGDYCK